MEGLASLRPVPPGSHGYYCDLAYVPIKVCAVQQGGRMLQLWDATCGLEEFVQAVGHHGRDWTVGEWVGLLNVRVTRRHTRLEIGEGTRVISLPPPMAPQPPPRPPPPEDQPNVRPPQRPANWRCDACFYVNYPSQSVCWRCKWPRPTRRSRKARKRGQVLPRLVAK
jgi:hypothetical protein